MIHHKINVFCFAKKNEKKNPINNKIKISFLLFFRECGVERMMMMTTTLCVEEKWVDISFFYSVDRE